MRRKPKATNNWVVVLCHQTIEPSTYGPFSSEEEAAEAAAHLQERWDLNAPQFDTAGFVAFVNVMRSMGQPWEDARRADP